MSTFTPPVSGPGYTYKSPKILAVATMILVGIATLVFSLDALFDLALLNGSAADLAHINAKAADEEFTESEGLLALGYLLHVLCKLFFFFIGTIVYLFWVYRVSANAHAFKPSLMTVSPGWAVGWHFIPFANIYMPYKALNETWIASHRSSDPGNSTLITVWWGGIFLANIAARATARMFEEKDARSIEIGAMIDLGATLAWVIGGIALILVIMDIGKLQAAAAEAGPTGPQPPTTGGYVPGSYGYQQR